MDLVGALLELGEESVLQAQPATGLRVDQRRPAPDALRIELLVPAAIQRVGQIDALAVAADLDHLRPTVEGPAAGVRGLPGDASEVDAPGLLRLERIADVVLQKLARAPGR